MHEQYNRRAREIWTKHAEAHKELPGMSLFPMQRPIFELHPDLLFVGMNPSFNIRYRTGRAHHLSWRATISEQLLAQFAAEEAEARENYKVFFGPLDRFAASVGSKRPEHLDLLPLRHTSQAEVVHEHWDKHGNPNKVIEACFALFTETLLILNPKVVVVANAGASRQVIKLLKLESTARGRFHRWEKLPQTSFFLSGMLSGQRALDEFSKDRLAADVHAMLRPEDDHSVA